VSDRLLREQITRSPSVARLSPGAAFRLPWYFLAADNYGVFIRNPEKLKYLLFPHIIITADEIASDLDEYERRDIGIIVTWNSGPQKVSAFTSWHVHQPVRYFPRKVNYARPPDAVLPLVARNFPELSKGYPQFAEISEKSPEFPATDDKSPQLGEGAENRGKFPFDVDVDVDDKKRESSLSSSSSLLETPQTELDSGIVGDEPILSRVDSISISKAMQIVSRFKEALLANHPQAEVTEANERTWLQEAMEMLAEGKKLQRISTVIGFVQRSPFWSARIWTMAALRRNWNQLCYQATHTAARSAKEAAARRREIIATARAELDAEKGRSPPGNPATDGEAETEGDLCR